MHTVPTSGRRIPAALYLLGLLLLASLLAAPHSIRAQDATESPPTTVLPPNTEAAIEEVATSTPPDADPTGIPAELPADQATDPVPPDPTSTVAPTSDTVDSQPATPTATEAPQTKSTNGPTTLAAAMRFSGVSLQGPDECTPSGFVLVSLVVQNSDPTFQGVFIQTIGVSTADGSSRILGLGEVPAASGDGAYLESVEGNFTTAFRDWQIRLMLIDGAGVIRQDESFPVQPRCTPEPPDPARPTITAFSVDIASACGAEVVAIGTLALKNVNAGLGAVMLSLSGVDLATGRDVPLDEVFLDPPTVDGSFQFTLSGTAQGAIVGIVAKAQILDDTNDTIQSAFSVVDPICDGPPPAGMRIGSLVVSAAIGCEPGVEITVLLDVVNTDPTFDGVEVALLSGTPDDPSNERVLDSDFLPTSSGDGTYAFTLAGDFSDPGGAFFVSARLFGPTDNTVQRLTEVVVPVCDIDAPPDEPTETPTEAPTEQPAGEPTSVPPTDLPATKVPVDDTDGTPVTGTPASAGPARQGEVTVAKLPVTGSGSPEPDRSAAVLTASAATLFLGLAVFTVVRRARGRSTR